MSATAKTSEDPPNYDDELAIAEKWWKERYNLLENRGYRLRPRYQPGWTPSWVKTSLSKYDCEDSVMLIVR